MEETRIPEKCRISQMILFEKGEKLDVNKFTTRNLQKNINEKNNITYYMMLYLLADI